MKLSFEKYPIDIIICILWSLILLPVVLLNITDILRVILGLPFILFIPGYVLIFTLFPTKKIDKGIDIIERIALSFGLSIAIVPLIGLGLNYTPWGIRLEPILLSIFIFIIGIGTIAIYRWIKTNPKEPHIVEELLKIPQLKLLDGIFGEFSLIALLIFRSQEEYYNVLNIIDRIMANSYFKKYHVIDTIKVFKTNGIELSNAIIDPDFKIDELDYLILKILTEEQGNKLISTYEIKNNLKDGYQTESSQPTIYNRIKKLEAAGIILNYCVNFNPRKIGFKGKYIVRIKPKDPSKYNQIALKLEKRKEIIDLFRIGENYGLLAIVRVKEIEDFGGFIKDLYESEDEGIEDTFTNFVLDERKPFTNFRIN